MWFLDDYCNLWGCPKLHLAAYNSHLATKNLHLEAYYLLYYQRLHETSMNHTSERDWTTIPNSHKPVSTRREPGRHLPIPLCCIVTPWTTSIEGLTCDREYAEVAHPAEVLQTKITDLVAPPAKKGISSDFTANWPFNSYFMFHHTLSRRFLPRTIFLDRKVIFYRGIYMVLARLRREKLFQDLKNVSTTTSMLHSFIDSKFATLHFIALQIWFRLVPHQFIVRSEFYKF